MKKIIIFILLCSPISMLSQSIHGKIYDAETTVKGALVINISQNIMTYTDDEGDFKILAKLKDTLYVSSLFHTKTFKEINKQDFEHIVIIEVKKTINELDEILLRDERERKFDSIKIVTQLNNQLKEDIKKRPLQYQPTPKYGVNLFAIIDLAAKLFKKKKPELEPIIPITYKNLDSLFKNDTFFNNTLLTFDLNIPIKYQPLFFDYCDSREIDSKLLEKNKQINLLEELVKCSEEFQIILKESKKDN